MGCGIGLHARYILLPCTWLHIAIVTTGFRSTYTTEPLPDTCPQIEDIAQSIETGNMTFTYHNAYKGYTTADTTDGDQTTCNRIYGRERRQPYITVQLHKQIRINYLRIMFDPYYASGWSVNSLQEINFSCNLQCYVQNYYKRTNIFHCAGSPIKELLIMWTGFESIICEIQIFTDKKCTVLPQVENGSYVTSTAANMSDYPFEIGTNATLQCAEGYEPSELQPITIECYTNGEWSFSNVTCRKTKCAVLPQVENGSYVTSTAANTMSDSFEIGTNATLQCAEGYEPSELQPITIECYTNGEWSFSNVTCQKIPNIQEGSHQQYLIYVIPIGISVLIIAAIALILLNLKQISIHMKKPKQVQVMRLTQDVKEEEDDDPLYESVTHMGNTTRTTNDSNNTQPQNVSMLKPLERSCTSSRSRDCVSLYENIYARPDIIEHTTNRNSSYEISTICNSVPSERSDSSEFVINDLYVSFRK